MPLKKTYGSLHEICILGQHIGTFELFKPEESLNPDRNCSSTRSRAALGK
jgi:hypothetical protein